MKRILAAITAIILFASCQKEISFDDVNSGNTGNGSGSGNPNGDLLVRALEISPATNDTNVITASWDAARRLLSYDSRGKVQGFITNISHKINRASDGKITIIDSKTFISGAISDSVQYRYFYTGNKVSYILASSENFLGPQKDSIILTYNATNQVTRKEIFSDLLFGTMEPWAKEEYQYDANGNVTVVTSYDTDFSGGYDLSGTNTNTYDGHKTAVILGEECYAVIGPANVSKNNIVKFVTNSVGSGTTYTATFSGINYNSFDRPSQAQLSLTPQPPGYNVKLLYYYQ